jgi:hypothetical protein
MEVIVLRWNARFLHILGFFFSFGILDLVLMLFPAFVGFPSYLGPAFEQLFFRFIYVDVLASKQLPSWHDRSLRFTMNSTKSSFFGFFLSFCILRFVLMLFFDFVGYFSYLGLSWSIYY